MRPISMTRAALLAAALVTGAATLAAQTPATIASKATGFERRDGFIPMYLEARGGEFLLEIPRDSPPVLFPASRATAFGSNPVGIDRSIRETKCASRESA